MDDLLLLVLIALSFLDAIALWYLWGIWLSDNRRPRSWFFLTVNVCCSIVTAATFIVGALAARAYLGWPPLPLQQELVIIALLLLGSVPIIFAVFTAGVQFRRWPNRAMVDEDEVRDE